MPKNLLQDMIKIKNKRTPVTRERQVLQEEEFNPEPIQEKINLPPQTSQTKSKTRYMLWSVAVISIIFFIFSISYLFFKVVVTVNPKIKDIALNESLSASLDSSGDTLPFDLVVIPGEEDKIVSTIEQKDLLQKARGVVLIYNAFSSATQRLDIDTRLEGSNGKIYKTEKAIVVPGMKGSTPGSVEVGIYGAVAGEEYNSDPLDFTILGFKGTPKYSKFYARSKGPIIGGFKGKSPVISDAEKTSVMNDLKTTLQAKLFKKATDQIPSGFILFKDAVFLNTDESSVDLASAKDNTLPVKYKATLYGILFDENKLTKKIAQDNIEEYDGSDVYLSNIRDLTFSLTSKDNASFKDKKNINFDLSGPTKIVWKVDQNKLATDLLGKSKKDFSQVLLQYPNIDSADLSISPFWKMSLPTKTKDIKVIVNYPK